jgi:hypothetical protein
MLVAVEAVTVAGVPLKITVLSDGVVLKPLPLIVTVALTSAAFGENEWIASTRSDNGRDQRLW